MTVTDLETLGAGTAGEPETGSGPNKKIVGKSPGRITFERLRADKVAVVCMITVAILVLLGVFAPLITKAMNIYYNQPPDGPTGTATDYLNAFYMPSIGPPYYPFTWDHPLGISPNTAQDNLAQLLYGIRTSFFVALVATALSTIIGVSIGLIAGFSRGVLDRVISFVIDTFLAFPFILGALALAPIITARFATEPKALARASLFALVTVLVVFGWMGLARLIRGQVLSLREREFVQAAQVIGVPTRRILFKELLPNLIAPIVVSVSLSLPGYVAAEAGLSYLGIGVTGTPSLGQTILRAQPFYQEYPLFLWTPVIAVMVLVVSLNLLGDSVRDAFDPKTRR